MAATTIQPPAAGAPSLASVRRAVARYPVAAFLLICYAINWAVVVPALRIQGGLPFDLQLWESLGTIIGVALAAFLVVAATDGWVGVRDLASRCVRWRVGARWYLVALLAMPIAILAATVILGAAPLRALVDQWALLYTVLLPRLLVGMVLFNVAEEIGWMGFLQARWQDRYGPLKASAMVTVPFTLFHLPVFFVDFGLALALVLLPVFVIIHFGVRVVLGWLYNNTGRSVLLVGLFHSVFNATLPAANKIIPGPGGTAALIGSGIIVVAAVVIIVVTKGRLSYRPRPAAQPTGASQ